MKDHAPQIRFKWLKPDRDSKHRDHFARGGGAWCFRLDGVGYGPYGSKPEAAEDYHGLKRQ